MIWNYEIYDWMMILLKFLKRFYLFWLNNHRWGGIKLEPARRWDISSSCESVRLENEKQTRTQNRKTRKLCQPESQKSFSYLLFSFACVFFSFIYSLDLRFSSIISRVHFSRRDFIRFAAAFATWIFLNRNLMLHIFTSWRRNAKSSETRFNKYIYLNII